jgi:hypothetical protein
MEKIYFGGLIMRKKILAMMIACALVFGLVPSVQAAAVTVGQSSLNDLSVKIEKKTPTDDEKNAFFAALKTFLTA